MDHHDTEDDPLQTALATAFAESPILPSRPSTSASTSAPHTESFAPDASSEQETEGGDDSWKEGYERLVTSWRAESATAREKAEQERERWRIIREQEDAEENRVGQKHVPTHRGEADWETVEKARKAGDSQAESVTKRAGDGGRRLSAAKEAAAAINDPPPRHGSPSPTDARDLVAGETPRGHGVDSVLESLLPRPEPSLADYTTSRRGASSATAPQSTMDDPTLSGSRTWEEVPSLDSSFPSSLSFPSRSAAASPEPRERPPPQQPAAPPSVTLAIFDSSLSTRARVLALVSSLAINLFLPFVNGVMLGFGEIFAKNVVVGFFGWKTPGTAVGLRAASRRK